MQAIITKYFGPTSTQGARIIAETASGIKMLKAWNYDLDVEHNHERAAIALADSLEWLDSNRLVTGATKDGYVHVLVSK